jgi:hypothetical protein
MRSISAEGLAKLSTQYGAEPISIVEVDWATGPLSYADCDLGQIPGKILDIGTLDNVINVINNTSSQEIAITLDDTDGSIKAILDTCDVHKRPARVYQYFRGLDLSDKFLVFSGVISSPVVWSERERTVSFHILSQLEDREVGFSAEEGQFPYLPADLVGKPWPMIFGTVINSPCLQINQAVKGTTLTGVGILTGVDAWNAASSTVNDADFLFSLEAQRAQASHCGYVASAWHYVNDDLSAKYLKMQNDINDQISKSVSQYYQQRSCESDLQKLNVTEAESKGLGDNPIRILGGEDFPQGVTVVIRINSGYFEGRFDGENFTIFNRWCPSDQEAVSQTLASQGSCNVSSQGQTIHFEDPVPYGKGGFFNPTVYTTHKTIVPSNSGGENQGSEPVARHFWAEPGASVALASDEAIAYIASIVPGTVLSVKAYKQMIGERRLTAIPADLYAVQNVDYGAVQAVQITLSRSLSSLDDGWNDDLYVCFESSVGPNTVDILTYLIETYTDLTCDSTTFADVKTKLTNFPANFPILERKNIITVLQEIAFQARCAVWLNNGVFYLKYLPEEPTSISTITESDIDAETGVEVSLSDTEDLVTKMRVTWRMIWAPESDRENNVKTMILRHNIPKYGTQERSFDFYIYNQPDIVYKCATFWLIRLSHTWKKAAFKAFLNKLNVETFDTVGLNFANSYVASGSVKALVEKANYNSAENCIDFECLVPVLAGQTGLYKFFWPAELPQDDTWPPQDEIAYSGGGAETVGNLPVGDTSGISGVIWVGGPNVVFGPQSDRGDKTPTDVGFTPQTAIDAESFSGLIPGERPQLNLRVLVPMKMPSLKPFQSAAETLIDIRKTKVIDSRYPEQEASYLDTVFYGINPNGALTIDRLEAKIADANNSQGQPLSDVLKNGSSYLCIRTDASIWDSSDGEHEFDFKYDEEGGKFGAGTAFLQD